MKTDTPTSDLDIPKRETVIKMLNDFGIDYKNWGNGTKTLRHLLSEIKNGEATLHADESRGILIREVSSSALDVYCIIKGKEYVLEESRQVFSNKTFRQRKLSTAVGEKMKSKEDPFQCAHRAMKEELGSILDYTLSEPIIRNIDIRESKSYPGLYSRHKTHMFRCDINPKYFRRQYVERRGGKVTYFIWKIV